MNVDFRYTDEEKEKIRRWKQLETFGENYKYCFVENGKYNDEGYKLYNFSITATFGKTILVSKNVVL